MILILIRHGESEHNIKNIFDSDIYSKVQLTENGTNQIIKASNNVGRFLEKFHHLNVNRVYSSPMMRTFQSTKIFMDTIKKYDLYKEHRFCMDYRISEIDMGDFNGKNVDNYPHEHFDKNHDFNGETPYDVYRRVTSFYNDLNDYNTNVIISHYEPIKQLVKHTTSEIVYPEKGMPIYIDTYIGKILNT